MNIEASEAAQWATNYAASTTKKLAHPERGGARPSAPYSSNRTSGQLTVTDVIEVMTKELEALSQLIAKLQGKVEVLLDNQSDVATGLATDPLIQGAGCQLSSVLGEKVNLINQMNRACEQLLERMRL